MTPRARVAIVLTQPDTVLEDTVRLCELGGMRQALDPGVTTILKDNISWHFPMPAANTTPWQLEGVIQALRGAGYTDVTCVQNQTVVTNPFKGEDLNGYVPIFQHYGIPVLFNFRPSDMSWVNYTPKAKMLALDHIYPEGIQIPDYFIGKNILHLPTVKTHMYTTTTGAMKNAFGGLLSKYRHYTHTWIHETLVDLLAIQKEIHPGLFAVMDGTTAGNGAGPRLMKPVVKNVMLASADQVAIDAVAARLMGFDPLSIKYIRLAHDQGLGCGDPREIEIVGDADVANESWDFKINKNSHTLLAWLSWFGPTKFLQKFLFHTPFVIVPTAIGEFEQDSIYWPLKYQFVAEQWRKETTWGHLFTEYQKQGVLGK
ncbi:uncharacterized conserved protein [Longilinea arvoryzae]|uniref:Uncharacterized conserved protein n=1 Tax=Longilinea arvoryzae TaxID=360412 RepID=A0A0S7BCI0_9CHLR|nr:DUF362 domain-containing protein [Longilinea arvoryzae]GAP12905.1 uncharacterized conserved protein [Longilinea arvoryzae]